jgi:hypothetical protein
MGYGLRSLQENEKLGNFWKKSQVLEQGLPNFEHLPLQMAK